MDSVLRSELIRYGEMAQACYDAFDFNPSSRYCGNPCRVLASKCKTSPFGSDVDCWFDEALRTQAVLLEAGFLNIFGLEKLSNGTEYISRSNAPTGLCTPHGNYGRKDEPIDKSKHWDDLEEEEQEEEMDEEELEDGMESVDTLSSTPTGTETPNEIEAEKGIR
ncbi:hypothetical protein YC2023_038486 [Brassica napus]